MLASCRFTCKSYMWLQYNTQFRLKMASNSIGVCVCVCVYSIYVCVCVCVCVCALNKYMMIHTYFQHPKDNATFLRVIAASCTRALVIAAHCTRASVIAAELY